MYVILTIDGGTEETDLWKVYKGRTFETLEEAEKVKEEKLSKSNLSSQIAKLEPLEGDADFGGLHE